MKQLIIGGARSGKSSLAERLALNANKSVVYIATANAELNDTEMANRIHHHQQRRPKHWACVETTIGLAKQIQIADSPETCILVDCLTLWLSNCLLDSNRQLWPEQKQALIDTLATTKADIIFVGNEVGLGIVPIGEANRRFIDENGFLHQSVASLCDRVIMTAAGLPLVFKGQPLADNIDSETR